MEFDMKDFLYTNIGLEEPRVRRRNLFEKLIRLTGKHGLPVIKVIAEVWEEACEHCKRSTPQRMFCRLVKLRLQEAKLWEEERRFDGMSLAEIIATGIFSKYAKLPLFDGQDPPNLANPKQAPRGRPGHHHACTSPTCKGCN